MDNSFNTDKIKAEINSVIQSIEGGNPDQEKIRETGSDILNTAASLLSGLGVDGHPLDGLEQAAEELKNKL
jgi:hypothetical protein